MGQRASRSGGGCLRAKRNDKWISKSHLKKSSMQNHRIPHTTATYGIVEDASEPAPFLSVVANRNGKWTRILLVSSSSCHLIVGCMRRESARPEVLDASRFWSPRGFGGRDVLHALRFWLPDVLHALRFCMRRGSARPEILHAVSFCMP